MVTIYSLFQLSGFIFIHSVTNTLTLFSLLTNTLNDGLYSTRSSLLVIDFISLSYRLNETMTLQFQPTLNDKLFPIIGSAAFHHILS